MEVVMRSSVHGISCSTRPASAKVSAGSAGTSVDSKKVAGPSGTTGTANTTGPASTAKHNSTAATQPSSKGDALHAAQA